MNEYLFERTHMLGSRLRYTIFAENLDAAVNRFYERVKAISEAEQAQMRQGATVNGINLMFGLDSVEKDIKAQKPPFRRIPKDTLSPEELDAYLIDKLRARYVDGFVEQIKTAMAMGSKKVVISTSPDIDPYWSDLFDWVKDPFTSKGWDMDVTLQTGDFLSHVESEKYDSYVITWKPKARATR